MHKQFTSFLKLTLGFMLLAGLTAPVVQADEEALWDAERLLNAYYAPTQGLALSDQIRFEQAQAALLEQDYETARQHLEALREAYPDFLPAQLRLAQCYLRELNPDEAQQVLEALVARLPVEGERTTAEHALIWQIRRLMAQSWMIQNEPEKAIEVLTQAGLEPRQLNQEERTQYHILLAKAYESQDQMILVHAELEKILAFNPVSGEARHYLQKLAHPMAKAYYRKGLEAFRARQFGQALPLAQRAHELVPESQAYLELYLQTHTRFQDEARARFEKARPVLTRELKKIRWALAVEDLNKARILYAALQTNPQVAYFLQPEQRMILPFSMQQTLTSLEAILKSENPA